MASFVDVVREKFANLRRDPRFALHSGSAEGDAFRGDAKLSGRAEQVTADTGRAAFARDAGISMRPSDFELFRVDLDQVVLVAWTTGGPHWSSPRGGPGRA